MSLYQLGDVELEAASGAARFARLSGLTRGARIQTRELGLAIDSLLLVDAADMETLYGYYFAAEALELYDPVADVTSSAWIVFLAQRHSGGVFDLVVHDGEPGVALGTYLWREPTDAELVLYGGQAYLVTPAGDRLTTAADVYLTVFTA